MNKTESNGFNSKRRMSLKGPPLRIALKEKTINSQSNNIDKRQSIAPNKLLKQPFKPEPIAQKNIYVDKSAKSSSNSSLNSRLDKLEIQIDQIEQVRLFNFENHFLTKN